MTTTTQADQLLDLLRVRGERGITPLEALTAVGSMRLGARIYDLRAAGYNIETHMVKTAGGAHVAKYVLREAVPQGQIGMFDEGGN